MTVAASPKLAAYAWLAGVGFLVALALGRPEPAVLAAPFLVGLLAGLVLAEEPELRITPRLDRGLALEGDAVELVFELQTATPIPWLQVVVALPAGLSLAANRDGAMVLGVHLARGERRPVCFAVRCERWGTYTLGSWHVRAHDPLGFFTFETSGDDRLPVRVHPRPETVSRLIQPLETQLYAGNQVARRKGDGIEFADVRPFALGDRLRRINWRLSSRQRELYVNEMHPERNTAVVLFLDTFSEVRTPGEDALDVEVRLAASLAERYVRQRDRVGVICFGGALRWLQPAMGLTHVYRILEVLLHTEIMPSYVWKDVDVIPGRTLPPKALVVALSPLLDARTIRALLDLRARGFDLAIIEVSPQAFLTPGSSAVEQVAYRLWGLKRETLRSQFRALGVPVAVWHHGRSLEGLLQEVTAFRRSVRRMRA